MDEVQQRLRRTVLFGAIFLLVPLLLFLYGTRGKHKPVRTFPPGHSAADYVLVPGKGLPGAILGVSKLEQVTAAYGKDCKVALRKLILCSFTPADLPRIDPRTDRPDLFEFAGGVLSRMVIGSTQRELSVEGGIELGSAQPKDVVAAFGPPQLIFKDDGDNYAYPARGIVFSFIGSELTTLELLRPAALTIDKFSLKIEPGVGIDGLKLGTATLADIESYYGAHYQAEPDENGFINLARDDSPEGQWRQRFAPSAIRVSGGKVVAMTFNASPSMANLANGVHFYQEAGEVLGILGDPGSKVAGDEEGESTWSYPKLGLTLTFADTGVDQISIARP